MKPNLLNQTSNICDINAASNFEQLTSWFLFKTRKFGRTGIVDRVFKKGL